MYLRKKLTGFSFQPPSRNRRERAELRPDFFDSAAIIEDDSVSVKFIMLFIYGSWVLFLHEVNNCVSHFSRDLECLCSEV